MRTSIRVAFQHLLHSWLADSDCTKSYYNLLLGYWKVTLLKCRNYRSDEIVNCHVQSYGSTNDFWNITTSKSALSLSYVGLGWFFLLLLTAPGPASIGEVLQQNVSLINELRELQRQRLNLNQLGHPSQRELEVAAKIQINLIAVSGHVRSAQKFFNN